jgi:hypothetical protein
MDRRTFLQTAAILGAAAPLPPVIQARNADPIFTHAADQTFRTVKAIQAGTGIPPR